VTASLLFQLDSAVVEQASVGSDIE